MSKRKSSIKSKKAQRVPYRVNPKRNMPRHTTKIKHKERILKAAREKEQVTYNGSPICLTVLQTRRERQVIFKVLKMKNLQPRLLYMARISFIIYGDIKVFQTNKS